MHAITVGCINIAGAGAHKNSEKNRTMPSFNDIMSSDIPIYAFSATASESTFFGLSISSTIAIGALSPVRNPHFRMRK